MQQNLVDKLIEKYPEQFQNLSYIECGDGWYKLIDVLCSRIQSRIDREAENGKRLNFWWAQIKEKFGGLRAYSYGADEVISELIYFAQDLSYTICEYTGNKGRLRNQKLDNTGQKIMAWMKTLDDVEANKEGYL